MLFLANCAINLTIHRHFYGTINVQNDKYPVVSRYHLLQASDTKTYKHKHIFCENEMSKVALVT